MNPPPPEANVRWRGRFLQEDNAKCNVTSACHACLCPRTTRLSSFRFHLRDFVNLALLVVCCPFADLLPILEIAGAHLGPIFPEPFPITGHDSIQHLSFGPDTAVLVVMNVFLRFGFLLGHRVSSKRGE